jgi:hypothetical protein
MEGERKEQKRERTRTATQHARFFSSPEKFLPPFPHFRGRG